MQFVIRGLRVGVEYEVMVCNANITENDLPEISEFEPECGFCRTCFIAEADQRNMPTETVGEFN